MTSQVSNPTPSPGIEGISSPGYARRFGGRWRPTRPAATLTWPAPRVHPGGVGAPTDVDFGNSLRPRIPALGVLEIEGPRLVLPWGWILGADRTVLVDHSWFANQTDDDPSGIRAIASRLGSAIDRADGTTLPGTTLSLLSEFHSNYCHFLLDALGRLALVEAAGIDLGSVDRILVPHPCSENARRILASLPLPAEKVVPIGAERRGVFLPERLIAPTFPGAPRCSLPLLPDYLRRRIPRVPPGSAPTRLYVDRAGGGRPLENRDAVLAVMKEYGFRVYDPAEHDDQPSDFAAASAIVGAHGAGLTNILFAPPGARVLELPPSDQVHPYYFTLALAAGHAHSFLPCRSEGERPAGSFGPSPFPFRVDIDALRQALAALGCDAARSPCVGQGNVVPDRRAERPGDRPPSPRALRRLFGWLRRWGRPHERAPAPAPAPDRAAGADRRDGPWRHAVLARAALKQGDEDGAIVHFRQALAGGPRPPQVMEGLARVLLRQERFDEADSLYRDLVDRHPQRPEGHRGRARVLLSRHEWQAAHDVWEESARLFPDSEESIVGMADALVRLGRFEEGEALLVQARERWPETLPPLIGLASAASAAGSFRLANERWQEALARFPDNLTVRGHHVLSLLSVVDVEGARRVFDVAPRESWNSRYLVVGAEIHAATYDWPAVLAIADSLGRTWPQELDARLREMELLVRVSRYTVDPLLLERSVALCETLVRRFPHSLKVRIALANGYVNMSRNVEALDLIDRLPDDLPRHSGVVALKAWRKAYGGDVEAAKEAWRGVESGHYHPVLHSPPGTFRHVDGRAAEPAAGDVLLFTVIRNEARRLPWFLDYYRRIGVSRFYVIDNDSTDGGTGFLLEQDDVHVFHTADSYARSSSGMRWINHFVERFGAGHWCLYVDVDEMLVVPGVEEHGLAPLLRHMERRGDEVCRGFMLDMHGPTIGHRPELRPGDDPLAHYPLFRAAYRRSGAVECPYWRWGGGVREPGGSIYHLTKTPIVRGGGAVRFLMSSHQTTPAAVSDATAVLLHFKLAGAPVEWTAAEIGDRLPGCVRRHLYGPIVRQGEEGDFSLVDASTTTYESSRQLISLGLMDCPQDFCPGIDGSPGGVRR